MGCNKNLKKSTDYLSRDSTFVFVTVRGSFSNSVDEE